MSPDIKGPGTFNGSRIRGHHNAKAKLTPSQVVRVWSMLHRGDLSISEIARRMKVSQPTISNIKAGRTWSHLTSTLGREMKFGPRSFVNTKGQNHNLAGLTNEKARAVFKAAHNGETISEVSARLCVPRGTVSAIKHRRRYASATAGLGPGSSE